nr:short-chain dehydrogenase/reductase SDRA-like [Ipomoea batatas]
MNNVGRLKLSAVSANGERKQWSKGIEVLGVVCHVSNAEHRKNLVERTVQRKSLEEKTLLNRLGKTDDMAAATAFLSSDDAAYITGETLVVAGGMPSRL